MLTRGLRGHDARDERIPTNGAFYDLGVWRSQDEPLYHRHDEWRSGGENRRRSVAQAVGKCLQDGMYVFVSCLPGIVAKYLLN